MLAHKTLSKSSSAGKFRGGLADESERVVKYHTATHLLHKALQEIFGDTVRQEGSNITQERLRFDARLDRKPTPEDIEKVTAIMNTHIEMALPVYARTMPREEAEKMGLDADVRPIIISVGNQMLLKGFDEALEGKEIGKKYTVNLSPEKAFGKRNPSMIKIIPIKAFREKEINPVPGMTLHLDQYIVKILSVSGGRVIVDFNNPLAGKEISYEFTAGKKIEDDKEKINALQDFFFRKRFDFEIKDKKVIFKDETIKPFVEIFRQKFKDITGFEFEVEVSDLTKQNKIDNNGAGREKK